MLSKELLSIVQYALHPSEGKKKLNKKNLVGGVNVNLTKGGGNGNTP